MRKSLQTRSERDATDGTLDRWGACGEDDAWPSVGTRVRGDRHGLARKVRYDPGLPYLNQGGRRGNTNAGTRDVNRRECDREMVMSVAYESGRARYKAVWVTTCGDGASDQLPRSRTPPIVARVCERLRSAGHHQRHDEQ